MDDSASHQKPELDSMILFALLQMELDDGGQTPI